MKRHNLKQEQSDPMSITVTSAAGADTFSQTLQPGGTNPFNNPT